MEFTINNLNSCACLVEVVVLLGKGVNFFTESLSLFRDLSLPLSDVGLELRIMRSIGFIEDSLELISKALDLVGVLISLGLECVSVLSSKIRFSIGECFLELSNLVGVMVVEFILVVFMF